MNHGWGVFRQSRESGQSLVIVLMSAAIGMIVSLGMMAALNNLQQGANGVKFRTDADTVNEEMRALLSSPQACLNSFGGRTVNASTDEAITTIYDGGAAPGAPRYVVGNNYGDRTVKLSSMKLSNFINDGAQTARMTLHNAFDVVKVAIGAQMVPRDLLLKIQMDSSNRIVGCIALSKMSDGIWQRSQANVNDIFYTAPVGLGRVAIGTTSPSDLIDLFGVSDDNARVRMTSRGGGGGRTWSVGTNGSPSNADPNFGLTFRDETAGADRMVISWSTGNVGIGSSAPATKLDVNGDLRYSGSLYNSRGNQLIEGNAGDWLRIGAGVGGFSTNAVAAYGGWAFGSGGVAVGEWNNSIPAGNLYVTGNVGVGNPNPQSRLDVNGEVRVGNTGQGCGGSNAGAMRFNSGNGAIEYCNGSAWVKMGGITRCKVGLVAGGQPSVIWSDDWADNTGNDVGTFPIANAGGQMISVHLKCE